MTHQLTPYNGSSLTQGMCSSAAAALCCSPDEAPEGTIPETQFKFTMAPKAEKPLGSVAGKLLASACKTVVDKVFAGTPTVCPSVNMVGKCKVEGVLPRQAVNTEDPALERGRVEAARLSELLPERETSDPVQDRVFHAAIKAGRTDAVIFLLTEGVSPSTLVEGISPLYRACEHGKIDIARLLLEKGALVTQKNDLTFRTNPFRAEARLGGDIPIGRHKATPMNAAVKAGNLELVRLLHEYGAPFDELEYGAPFDRPDPNGISPVFLAVKTGHEELALFFIEKGADLKRRYEFPSTSLLAMAIEKNQPRVVQELVRRGVSLKEPGRSGEPPLHIAAQNSPAVLDFLLKKGGKEFINDLWLDTFTPLAQAVKEGELENVKLLVEARADLSLKYEGRDILQIAKEKLQTSESHHDGERIIEERRAIVDYLRQVMGRAVESEGTSSVPPVKVRKVGDVVVLSDGTEMHIAVVKSTILLIRKAIDVAGVGQPFLLVDLKDKANKEDDWVPTVNPFCNSIEIMKKYLLIDERGYMLPHVRSLVKDCIVGDDLAIRLQIPESWTGL